MFIQARSPCFTVYLREYPALVERLYHAGYTRHKGPRWTRRDEIDVWKRILPRGMQIHVQVVFSGQKSLEVYAHTEPAGYGFRHLWAALTDSVDFDAGRRQFLQDIGKGFES